MKRILPVILIVSFILTAAGMPAVADDQPKEPVPEKYSGIETGIPAESTEIVILSTTDMHGKCWERNILTETEVKQNMLRVSTAVQEIRKQYRNENVILIDNGDLFQGTPVSETHLVHTDHSRDEQEAMALCLKEIGYDALVLGNHEFNFSWDVMCGVYDDLRQNNVAVLAANVYYDGTDNLHEDGENAFDTYIIREVTVNGHTHKVGILGLENTDIPCWDLPANYPGLGFSHPDNPDFDLGKEAGRYISLMRAEGCEMIILSYHGGLGNTAEPLAFGINTANQGLRILENTDCLDLLILGHDHSTGYSNMLSTDSAGRQVAVVNSGGQDLTKTVFRLSEDTSGKLVCMLQSTENLSLSGYEPDGELEEKIRPYADLADTMMDEPIGFLSGEWDGSTEFYTGQNNTQDLINAAMISVGTKRMMAKYGASGMAALQEATGLDHLDVDAACSTVTNSGYIAHSGKFTTRDAYRMCRFANSVLVIPMYGQTIREILEENASERLTARLLNNQVYFFTKSDLYTNLVFGGVNFQYDMSKPAGERVTVDSFASGRSFNPGAIYLVAVNNYILGNNGCGLRIFSEDDALWSQTNDDAGGSIQDIIQEFIIGVCEKAGSVTADVITWRWGLTYSEASSDLKPYHGPVSASLASAPQDGHRYIIYHEGEGCTMTALPDGGGLLPVAIPSHGNNLVGALPEEALIFTVHMLSKDTLMLTDMQGRFLTCGKSGGLSLTEEAAENDLSFWQITQTECGYYLKSAGAENDQALEWYGGKILTYRHSSDSYYLFNFYEVK